jgi:hypothetical protein
MAITRSMRGLGLAAAAGALWLASAALAAKDKKPQGEFTAMAHVDTPIGMRTMGIQGAIQRPITVQEAEPLKKTLADGGQQALLNAIKGGNRGYFRLGAVDYPIDLVVAKETKDGFKYVVVTARSLRYEEVQEGSASLEHPFTVAIFDVPEFGSGSGELYTKAALFVEEDGWIRADQYGGRPGMLKDVKRR